MTLHLLNGGHPPGYSSNGPSAVPLHLAAAVGCAEVVDLLALAGADVNVTNGRGDTPVGIAAAKGFLDVVEVLLRHGAGGSDFARLIEAQQTASYSNRKSAPPLSFQAAAGGHIKVDHHPGLNQPVVMLSTALILIGCFVQRDRSWRCSWKRPEGRRRRGR